MGSVIFFSLQGSPRVSFCPKFHFHFREWKWNLVLHYFVLYSKQQHVTRARAPKHVMRVEIYWEKKHRKGLLSITRSGRKIKNIMTPLHNFTIKITIIPVPVVPLQWIFYKPYWMRVWQKIWVGRFLPGAHILHHLFSYGWGEEPL